MLEIQLAIVASVPLDKYILEIPGRSFQHERSGNEDAKIRVDQPIERSFIFAEDSGVLPIQLVPLSCGVLQANVILNGREDEYDLPALGGALSFSRPRWSGPV